MIAVHLAVTAHRDGQGTTLLDADPQGSASDWHHRMPEGYDSPDVQTLGRERTLSAAVGQAGGEAVIIDAPARTPKPGVCSQTRILLSCPSDRRDLICGARRSFSTCYGTM
jgi:hypothetical protein